MKWVKHDIGIGWDLRDENDYSYLCIHKRENWVLYTNFSESIFPGIYSAKKVKLFALKQYKKELSKINRSIKVEELTRG